jgi:hypothetical protein
MYFGSIAFKRLAAVAFHIENIFTVVGPTTVNIFSINGN